MKKSLLLILLSFAISQEAYDGEINFNYSGTESGTFNSIVQDTLVTGFCFNQIGLDTSFVLMGALTQQGDDEFDLFFAFLRDTTFPVQPRTWSIPGEGDETDPTNLENIVVLMEGLDSAIVAGLFGALADSSFLGSDSLSGDSLFTTIFTELSGNLYFGISGEVEITERTDSSFYGDFDVIMLKPEFQIPPHIISISDGSFNFQQVSLPELSLPSESTLPNQVTLHPAYPNPFNPSTTLSFELSKDESTQIQIFNLNGQLVELIQPGQMNAGIHTIKWDASPHPSGIYFATLVTRHSIQTTKLLFMK